MPKEWHHFSAETRRKSEEPVRPVFADVMHRELPGEDDVIGIGLTEGFRSDRSDPVFPGFLNLSLYLSFISFLTPFLHTSLHLLLLLTQKP